MVHILTIPKSVHKPIREQINNPMVFNCMGSYCKQLQNADSQKSIHDAEAISQRIEKAISARKQLDADIFEREKRICKAQRQKIRYKM
jgi:hypothetical protein